jgi:hypothetical protein
MVSSPISKSFHLRQAPVHSTQVREAAHARCCEIHSAWPSRRAQKAANDSNPPRFGSQHEEPAPFATCPKRGALRLCRLFLSSLTPRVVADRYQRHGCWVSKRAERTSVPNSGGLL